MKQLSIASLFAGIGGFDLAAERLGMRVAWSCEIDPFARKVLARHWPQVECYPDVRRIEPFRAERVDLLTGGFPCQDLSVAGRRAGLAGERSGLFWEIVRLAGALRPRWLVLENVPGLLSSEGGSDMGMVVGALRDLGYLGAWRVLDAQWFGVAQRRRRVFLVGCLGRDRLAALLPFLASGNGHTAPRREAGKGAARCVRAGLGRSGSPERGDVDLISRPLGGGSGKRGYRDDLDHGAYVSPSLRAKHNDPHRADMAAYVCGDVSGTLAGAMLEKRSTGSNPIADMLVAHTLRGEGFDASEDGTGRGTPLLALKMREGCAGGGKGPLLNGERAFTIGCDQDQVIAFTAEGTPKHGVECGTALDSVESRRPSVNGSSVRRLTPTECERLQGFSWRDAAGEWQDGHTCLCGRNRGRSAGADPCRCPDGPRYRALGNAVAIPPVEWILGHIQRAEATC